MKSINEQFEESLDLIYLIIEIRALEYYNKINNSSNKFNGIKGLSKNKEDTPIELTSKIIEDYLQKRGYIKTIKINFDTTVYCKGFVCITFGVNKEDKLTYFKIWHDIPNSKPYTIYSSILSHLAILLKYMESRNMGN